MFINTSNRLTKFYRSHKTSIDTLLLLIQIFAQAIALLTLLSILGWVLAINQAIAWLNKLVEDSLEEPKLLMPSVYTESGYVPNAPNSPEADAILAEWRDRIGARLLAEDAIALQVNKLQGLSIRQLKKMARDRKISGYSNLTKRELIVALN